MKYGNYVGIVYKSGVCVSQRRDYELKRTYLSIKCRICGSITEGQSENINRNNRAACCNRSGFSYTNVYRLWSTIKKRCYFKNFDNYHRYGGRGIKVCEEWLNSSKAFCEWAMKNGYKKGLQIDRKDTDGDYCPENCRFITPKENSRNKSNNLRFAGKSLAEICELYGVHYQKVRQRVSKNKWPLMKALLYNIEKHEQ